MMVRSSFVLLLAIAILEACFDAAVGKEKRMSIDQKIMAAADDPRMFDLIHMMPNGEMMMLVQLDMLLTPHQYGMMQGGQQGRSKRKAVKDVVTGNDGKPFATRWPKERVFYDFHDNSNFTEDMTKVIEEAIEEWETYTCLNFTRVNSDTTAKIVFFYGEGCSSPVGYQGTTQYIFLGSGCYEKSTVIHEIGHAIGWIHEHARPDRDDYVRVNYSGIPEMYYSQFDTYDEELVDDCGVQYDYRSIMHYGGDQPVPMSMKTVYWKYQDIIGMGEGLSYKDAKLANLMYSCAGKSVGGCRLNDCRQYDESYMDKNCLCMCPGDGTRPVVCGQGVATPTAPEAPPTTTTPPTAVSTAAPESMKCRDLRDDCASRVKKGECSMKPGNMALFCMKSCNFCDKQDVCMDYEEACPLLQLSGLCDDPVFQSHTHKRCKKSCGVCTPTDACQMQHDLGLMAASTNTGHQKSATGAVAFTFVALTLILFSN